jgi:hypothetical protein
MNSSLDLIKTTLLDVTKNVNHYFARDKTDDYIVWAEDGEGASLHANNKKSIKVTQGTIDYFTKSEDNLSDQIEAELTTAGVSFSLNSVGREDETGYIHYEWVFEVS